MFAVRRREAFARATVPRKNARGHGVVTRVRMDRRGGEAFPNQGAAYNTARESERRSGSAGPPPSGGERQRPRQERRGGGGSPAGGERSPARNGARESAGAGRGRGGVGSNGRPGSAQTQPRRTQTRRRQDYRSKTAGRRDNDVLINRSFLLNKPVITRTSGTNLGVVNQMWVDTKEWRVVCLDVRENMFYGEMGSVMLDRLKQIGDVVLVHDESDAQQHVVVYGLNYLVGSEVVTEVGGYLGKCRDFTFNPEDGQIATIEFDSFGTPVVPSSVLSTYAVNCSEVVSVGPDRIVVAAGAESRVQQLSSGVMQRLALYEPPWEAAYRDQYEMDYYGGYTLPPYQDQYSRQDQMVYRDDPYGRQDPRMDARQGRERQRERQPVEQEQRRPQQQSYEDFIEVQEEEPVLEAQVQQSDFAKYNKDEDRL